MPAIRLACRLALPSSTGYNFAVSKIIGIDLGTTNSLVAIVEAGIPYVMADRQGQRLTPSVVYFPGDGQPAVVGREAGHWRVARPERTVYSVKRFIGRRFAEIGGSERNINYPLASFSSGGVAIPIGGQLRAPEEVSAEVLRKLKADAEACLGEPVTRAVITVPAYFHDAQRQATKRAGELAGFTVERIVNEPTAAALAYGLNHLQDRTRIAVYDFGGGTFDLSILELNEGVFQVLATNGHTMLGGDDLDQRIVDFLRGKVVAAGGPDLAGDRPALARLREAAEQAKIRLSTMTQTEIALPFLTPDFNFQHRMRREELEDLTRDIVLRTQPHCLRALADAKIQTSDLAQVILVGGQTRMPLVRRLVADIFQCVEFAEERGSIRLGTSYHQSPGTRLNTSQNPDEAVALGAAIQAEILSGGFKNLLLLDVTPLSLGLETFGGLMNVIIPRNSTIPVKAGEVFTTAMDRQTSMLIHVLQGERERARDNWSLGKFTLEFEPARRGTARVGVQFEIDANGILQVLARDIHTGQEKQITLSSAVDVDDAEVQKMVETSVQYAFEDLQARQWIEGRLRAEETMKATTLALGECGSDLAADIRERIDLALRQVRRLLSAGEGAVAGDPSALRQAVQELDQATYPLAELQMDRVMEAMLQRKGLLPGTPPSVA